MKATAFAMRALSCSIVVSLSSKRGGSTPARRATPFLARSVATCTCRVSANMSGASRHVSSTEGSIFLAAAKAAPLSRTPDSAFSVISTAGSKACDIENDIEQLLCVDGRGQLACGRGPCTQSIGVASRPLASRPLLRVTAATSKVHFVRGAGLVGAFWIRPRHGGTPSPLRGEGGGEGVLDSRSLV